MKLFAKKSNNSLSGQSTSHVPDAEIGGDDQAQSTVHSAKPMGFFAKELAELLIKIDEIERKCLGEEESDGKKQEIDEFLKMKKFICELQFDTKNMIREKFAIQNAQGNTVEVIKMNNQIEKNLNQMDMDFVKLKEVFKKQTKHRGNLTEDDLDIRFKEMQVMKKQLDECKMLVKRGGEFSDEQIKTLTDFRAQMDNAGIAPPGTFDGGSGKWRDPTPEEQAVMKRWAERDKQFDEQIREIGDVVDRLGEIAVQIGDKAATQEKMILELTRQADEANAEVIEVNNQLKTMLESKGGPGLNIVCKLILTMILVGLLFFILNNIMNRIGF